MKRQRKISLRRVALSLGIGMYLWGGAVPVWAQPMRWAAVVPSYRAPGELSAADEQLLEAALTGNQSLIQQALAAGARLEARDRRLDLTPLMLALYRDHPLAFQDLLAAGADINARNPRGQTPLMMLASGGQLALVEHVLEAGAALNAQDELGNTALMWAAYWGHLAVVETLIARQAQTTLSNDDGNTALHLAASGGLANQTRKLLQKPTFTFVGRKQYGEKVADSKVQMFKTLVAAGTPLNAVNRWGQTALMLTAEHATWEPIAYLIEAGASLTPVDHQGKTLKDYLTQAGNQAWVERL